MSYGDHLYLTDPDRMARAYKLARRTTYSIREVYDTIDVLTDEQVGAAADAGMTLGAMVGLVSHRPVDPDNAVEEALGDQPPPTAEQRLLLETMLSTLDGVGPIELQGRLRVAVGMALEALGRVAELEARLGALEAGATPDEEPVSGRDAFPIREPWGPAR